MPYSGSKEKLPAALARSPHANSDGSSVYLGRDHETLHSIHAGSANIPMRRSSGSPNPRRTFLLVSYFMFFILDATPLKVCSHIEYNCSRNEYEDWLGGSFVRPYAGSHTGTTLWPRRSVVLYAPNCTRSKCQRWRGATRA